MTRSVLALAAGALLLAACAASPTDPNARRDDDAYVPIGSNIPRKGAKPPEPVVPAGATMGPYTSNPGLQRGGN